MLKEAKEFLNNEYLRYRNVIPENTVYSTWYDEKIRHSMQVFGAGNYLVRRIKWLQNKSSEYVEMVRTAVLLHDIGRFREIEALIKENKRIDHGVEAAKFLQSTEMFNDIRIWLPIYHHGHLIEELYHDEQYQNLPENLRNEVKLICFIIRDADKIANLHMIVNEPDIRPLFLSSGSGNPLKDYSISDFAAQDAFSGKTVRRTPECTIADRMLGYLSWFNDINYCYSVNFCEKLGVIQKLKACFAEICSDKEFADKYLAYFDKCLCERAFLD